MVDVEQFILSNPKYGIVRIDAQSSVSRIFFRDSRVFVVEMIDYTTLVG
jgi:hypothetical protein